MSGLHDLLRDLRDDEDARAQIAALISPVRTAPRLALRVTEAAAALGVSLDYFSMKISPDLRIVRDGRTKAVPVAELARWLDENAAYVLGDR